MEVSYREHEGSLHLGMGQQCVPAQRAQDCVLLDHEHTLQPFPHRERGDTLSRRNQRWLLLALTVPSQKAYRGVGQNKLFASDEPKYERVRHGQPLRRGTLKSAPRCHDPSAHDMEVLPLQPRGRDEVVDELRSAGRQRLQLTASTCAWFRNSSVLR